MGDPILDADWRALSANELEHPKVNVPSPIDFSRKMADLFGAFPVQYFPKSGTVMLRCRSSFLEVKKRPLDPDFDSGSDPANAPFHLCFTVKSVDEFIKTRLTVFDIRFWDKDWVDGARAVFFWIDGVAIHIVEREIPLSDLPLIELP